MHTYYGNKKVDQVNPDKFWITETGADTIELKNSDGIILTGITSRGVRSMIMKSKEFREDLENSSEPVQVVLGKYMARFRNLSMVEYEDSFYLIARGTIP